MAEDSYSPYREYSQNKIERKESYDYFYYWSNTIIIWNYLFLE